MNRIHNLKFSNTSILITLFFTLMFLATFNSLLPSLKIVGFSSVFLTLTLSTFILFYYFVSTKEMYRIHFNIFIPTFLFLAVMVIGIYINRSTAAFESVFQFFTVICLFMFFSLIEWNKTRIKLAKLFSLGFLFLLPLIANLGHIGAFMILPIFFILLDRKKSILNIAFLATSLYFIYLAEMRAVFILLGAALFTYMFWKVITKTKFRMTLFFTGLMTILIGFIFVYPKLIYWSKFPIIESYVYQYTGKSLMSGRNRLWDTLTDIVNQKPFLGHGTGIIPYNVADTTLSAHNLYLQTALQNGWIGLILLILIFFVIWISYFRSKLEYATRLSASFFIGILVYQSFEIVLTQNKMDTALFFWLIISVGISYSIYKKQPVT